MANDSVLPSPPTKPKHNRVDVAKALKLRLQGATLPAIAALQGVSKQAIDPALTAFEPFLKGCEPGQLTAYSEERASLFNVVEGHLTASLLDPAAMAKASLNNRAYALKVIHEARRLESGQATSNVSVIGKLVMAAESKLGTPGIDKSSTPEDVPPATTV
jgi:hypothetical protein